jgi:hypothetical protein
VRCAPAAGRVRCSVRTRQRARWIHFSRRRMRVICTSGTHRCSWRVGCAMASVGVSVQPPWHRAVTGSVRHDRELGLRVVLRYGRGHRHGQFAVTRWAEAVSSSRQRPAARRGGEIVGSGYSPTVSSAGSVSSAGVAMAPGASGCWVTGASCPRYIRRHCGSNSASSTKPPRLGDSHSVCPAMGWFRASACPGQCPWQDSKRTTWLRRAIQPLLANVGIVDFL